MLFPTIAFNGRNGGKTNAAAWLNIGLICWTEFIWWIDATSETESSYFLCCLIDISGAVHSVDLFQRVPPAYFPDRLGTDRRDRGIPAYASISPDRSIAWHLRSSLPSMALLRPYNTLTLFLSFFFSLLLIHHRCSFLFFFFFSFPNMEDNLSRGSPFYFLLPEHSRFVFP